MIIIGPYNIPLSWPYISSVSKSSYFPKSNKITVEYASHNTPCNQYEFSHVVDGLSYIRKEIEKNRKVIEMTNQGRFLLKGHLYLNPHALRYLLCNPAHDLHQFVTDDLSVEKICYMLSRCISENIKTPLYVFKKKLEYHRSETEYYRWNKCIVNRCYIKDNLLSFMLSHLNKINCNQSLKGFKNDIDRINVSYLQQWNLSKRD